MVGSGTASAALLAVALSWSTVSCSTATSGLQELLGLVDIVLPNEAEACRMTQTNDVEAAAEALAQHTELALVEVVVHLVRGLAHLGERVHRRQDRLDPALGDEPVGGPRLGVVGEVR